ncbi:uncharacterized protein LOC124125211 [Haliotis rufescens]|uniref:uncharacterized protein LOC124125211 n=1 Tax=Haliotis rufescens TaxID=6454 RepID=UPI00201EE055|nr:uncharacterized protein LOC124125211 [Haliotis rufescens]
MLTAANSIDRTWMCSGGTTIIRLRKGNDSIKWTRDPNISWLIDSFLTWTSDPPRSSSTIVSDSVTDCRLLVLLLNIASRLQDDGRVDVINNMRQLYTRLGGPPFTEADVTFCLESAQRRLVSSNVYANF